MEKDVDQAPVVDQCEPIGNVVVRVTDERPHDRQAT